MIFSEAVRRQTMMAIWTEKAVFLMETWACMGVSTLLASDVSEAGVIGE